MFWLIANLYPRASLTRNPISKIWITITSNQTNTLKSKLRAKLTLESKLRESLHLDHGRQYDAAFYGWFWSVKDLQVWSCNQIGFSYGPTKKLYHPRYGPHYYLFTILLKKSSYIKLLRVYLNIVYSVENRKLKIL